MDLKTESLRALIEDDSQNTAKLFTDNNLTPTQLRKFYSAFKNIERKYTISLSSNDTKVFERLLPQIKLIKAQVTYAESRATGKEKYGLAELCKWLSDAVTSINTEEEFKNFLLYFEAVVGYAKDPTKSKK